MIKKDLMIWLVAGFVAGAIFLIWEGLAGMVSDRLSDRVKVGVPIVLFGIVFYQIKNMKK